MLALSSISLLVPAIFHLLARGAQASERQLSLEISIVLFVTYGLGLLFSLKTHRYLYDGERREQAQA